MNQNRNSYTMKWKVICLTMLAVITIAFTPWQRAEACSRILWNDNKFMSSDSVSAVPEPGAGAIVIAALISLAIAGKR